MRIVDLINEYLDDASYLNEVQKTEKKRAEIKKEVLVFLDEFLAARCAIDSWRDHLKKISTGWTIGRSIPMIMSVYTVCSEFGRLGQLEAFVRRHLFVPKFLELRRIEGLVDFVKDNYESRRNQSGRLLFLLSIFWNIQKPEVYPIFYPKAKKALKILREHKLILPAENIENVYDEYLDLVLITREIKGLMESHHIQSYQVEHFLFWLAEKK